MTRSRINDVVVSWAVEQRNSHRTDDSGGVQNGDAWECRLEGPVRITFEKIEISSEAGGG